MDDNNNNDDDTKNTATISLRTYFPETWFFMNDTIHQNKTLEEYKYLILLLIGIYMKI